MATLNIGMKVNRAITGATTVNANAYAIVTYSVGVTPLGFNAGVSSGAYGGAVSGMQNNIITRYFGPGQSIPASFTQSFKYVSQAGTDATSSITWSILSGVELINTI